MGKMTEYEMVAFYIGKRIVHLRLEQLSDDSGPGNPPYDDCQEYIITSDSAFALPGIENHFGISNVKRMSWQRNSIRFQVSVYVREDRLVGAHLFKIKFLESDHAIDRCYEMEPTNKEIEIAREILSYVVGGDLDESDPDRK